MDVLTAQRGVPMQLINTSGGLSLGGRRDNRLAGDACEVIDRVPAVAVYAADYPGLRLSPVVSIDHRVAAGAPLFVDRRDDRIQLRAPVAGTVQDIRYGIRRRVESLIIRCDVGASWSFRHRTDGAPNDADALIMLMLASGLWPCLRERPFDRVAQPRLRPEWLFVTSMDTYPGAPDVADFVQRHASDYAVGIGALSKLAKRHTFVCRSDDVPAPPVDLPQVRDIVVRGSHPAGLPGTHMHRLASVDAARRAWQIGYPDVVRLGHLITHGVVDNSQEVAIPAADGRGSRLARVPLGVAIDAIATVPADSAPLVSGPELQADRAPERYRFLRRHHRQLHWHLSARPRDESTPVATEPAGFGQRLAAALGSRGREYHSGMLPLALFDRLWPSQLPVIPLLRAMLSDDQDTACEFGLLALAADDFVLCTAACPVRLDYTEACRVMLERLAQRLR